MKRKTLTRLILLWVGLCGVATEEVLSATPDDSSRDSDLILTPQNNRNGWVNPEDLTPMPQCVAQQDQSYWLNTMSACTGKRCTRHFGFICSHHQWLTQASCLSTAFSPDVVKHYFPYCSRSILAKAQLYQWVRDTTSRTWLVDVGDANELQNLSPASLSRGFAAVSRANNAPTCLTGSVSAISMEPFQHVLASCSFTSTTQHTGRADRPWEYRGDLESIIALDFETVGYSLTGGSIEYGDYFDRDCFCRAFALDPEREACSERLEWTQEQLWMHATCGPTSLPSNREDSLKVIGSDYIPIEDWHLPTRVMEVGKRVTGLDQQCATDACGIDSSGYCKVKRTVSRACVCHNIDFETCGASCQDFETRIAYVNWLHDFCGRVQDWHGLPDNWPQLASLTAVDMIPWHWTIRPSNNWNNCASNVWKVGSFALVNAATFIFALCGRGTRIHRLSPRFPRLLSLSSWFAWGIFLAALQLLTNWVNVILIQGSLGYEDIPVTQLMFLWCLMPRPAWMTFLLIILQPFDAIDFSAAKSSLFAEFILQALSAYYMVLTVHYGLKHNFFLRSLEGAERGLAARFMYIGALLWVIITAAAFFWVIRTTRRINSATRSYSYDKLEGHRSKRTTSKTAESRLMDKADILSAWLGQALEIYWIDKGKSRGAGETQPFVGGERRYATGYGTLPFQNQMQGRDHEGSRRAIAELCAVTGVSMLLVWLAQCGFWGGFIGLSSDEFCVPRLALLTVVWGLGEVVRTAVCFGGGKEGVLA